MGRTSLLDSHSSPQHAGDESNEGDEGHEGHEEGHEEEGDEGCRRGGADESHEGYESDEGYEEGHESHESDESNEGDEEVKPVLKMVLCLPVVGPTFVGRVVWCSEDCGFAVVSASG